LAGGGGAWWLQAQRQARAAEAALRRQRTDGEVALALTDARLLREQARGAPLGDGPGSARRWRRPARPSAWPKPARRLPNYVSRRRTWSPNWSRKRRRPRRDRGLLARLLEARGPHEGPPFSRDDQGSMVQRAQPSADERFASAFRDWGLDVVATPTAEAAERLRARPAAVVSEVVATLDEWAGERRRQGKPRAEWQRLAAVAATLDEHPDSRRRELWAILTRGRLPAERALGEVSRALLPLAAPAGVVPGEDRNRLRRLAEQTDAAAEPVLGLLTLARALGMAGDDALAVRRLRAALRARPQEVVLHYELGKLLGEQRPPRWGGAVECYAAARALRPELGTALADALVRGAGRFRGAVARARAVRRGVG
jgi:hypothetical protein